MKKALIINEGYSNNLGDQSINQSITSLFKTKGYDTSFLYLSNPSLTKLPNYTYLSNVTNKTSEKSFLDKIKTYFVFFYWLFLFRKKIINILTEEKFDVVAIGGGQLIISSGNFSLSSFSITLFWFSLLIKRYSKAKLLLIAVGVSKNFNIFESFLLSKTLKRVETIWVRDVFSKKILKEKFNIYAKLIPDIAFFDSSKKKKKKKKEELALVGITSYDEVFLRYNKNNKLSKEEYFKELYHIVLKYQKKAFQVKLFYTTITDAKECINFRVFLIEKYNKNIDICKIEDLSSLVSYLDKAKYVYSGRMHALILGLKSKCNVETYLISQKLQSFDEMYVNKTFSIDQVQKEINQQLIDIK